MRLGHLPRALFPLLVACVLHPQRAFVSSTCARLLRPGDASSAYSDRTFRRLQAASAGVAECDSSRVDLLFLVDASGSIQAQNFAYARQFIESVASAFDMSAGQARMGVTTFATAVTNHIQLGSHTSYCDFVTRVGILPYDSGSTFTSDGLRAATQQFAQWGRPR